MSCLADGDGTFFLVCLQDRLEHYSYFGIPAYQPSVNTYTYSGAIPRPQTRAVNHVHINGHAAESTADPDFRDYDRNKYRGHDTFQRDLHRTLDHYNRRDSDDNSYHAHM